MIRQDDADGVSAEARRRSAGSRCRTPDSTQRSPAIGVIGVSVAVGVAAGQGVVGVGVSCRPSRASVPKPSSGSATATSIATQGWAGSGKS